MSAVPFSVVNTTSSCSRAEQRLNYLAHGLEQRLRLCRRGEAVVHAERDGDDLRSAQRRVVGESAGDASPRGREK